MRGYSGRNQVVWGRVLLGLGLGGFFDGIVLHQVLQWHHMLTSAGYPATSVGNAVILRSCGGGRDGCPAMKTILSTLTALVLALLVAMPVLAGGDEQEDMVTKTFELTLYGDAPEDQVFGAFY